MVNGVRQTARIVGVTGGAVCQWKKVYSQFGEEAFEAYSPPGRPLGLLQKQKSRLEKLLLKSARRHGYWTELWILQKVAEVIEKYFGIGYDICSVWHILKGMASMVNWRILYRMILITWLVRLIVLCVTKQANKICSVCFFTVQN